MKNNLTKHPYAKHYKTPGRNVNHDTRHSGEKQVGIPKIGDEPQYARVGARSISAILRSRPFRRAQSMTWSLSIFPRAQ